MTREMFFISGLPRSGSTLLANILNQNDRIHATETSGLIDIVYPIKNGWNDVINHKTISKSISELRVRSVISSIFDSYHAEVNDDIVVGDKNRGWLGCIEMLDEIFGESLKIVVCVRDTTEILASIEVAYRNTNRLSITTQEAAFPKEMAVLESRLAFWCRSDQFFGSSFNMLKEAIAKGYKDRIHILEYRDLVSYPDDTLNEVYQYLGIEKFCHDFDNVAQTTLEDDRFHGFSSLHTIRPKVSRSGTRWSDILGSAGDPYLNQEFWRKA